MVPAWVTLLLVLAAVTNLVGLGLGGLPGWINGWLDWLGSFAAAFLSIFIEAVPFLLLGSLASGIIEVFIDREEIARWVPRSRWLGALAGSFLGLVFPVSECGVVPFTRRLISKGVPVSIGVATLLAGPALNPIAIASTLAAFGAGPVFWGRMGLSLVIAILVSLIISLHDDPTRLLRHNRIELRPQPMPQPAESLSTDFPPAERPGFAVQLRRTIFVSVDEFFEFGRYLVLGAVLAAVLRTFVPLLALLDAGQGPVLPVLSMSGLAVLLSVGSTADAFIAQAFTGTFTAGSILAFLVLGPMVDVKHISLFLRVFKPRMVAYLVLLPFGLTLVFTVFINYFGQGW